MVEHKFKLFSSLVSELNRKRSGVQIPDEAFQDDTGQDKKRAEREH